MNIVETTNTVFGMINEFTARMGVPLNPNLACTLNTKYGIAPSVVPIGLPTIKYVGIGNMGYYNVGDDGLANTYKPQPDNQDLYNPIPFRIRPLDEDLSAAERANYRMRTIQTIGGVQYVCYWLKAITFPSNAIETKYVNTDNIESDYNIVPNLTPTPIKVDDDDDATADGKPKVIVKITGEFIITAEEISEYVSVFHAGDARYGKVSEIGIYTGEDRIITGAATGGGTINYTEAIYTQLSLHRCSQGNSDFTNTVQTITFGNGNLYLL